MYLSFQPNVLVFSVFSLAHTRVRARARKKEKSRHFVTNGNLDEFTV